MNLTTESERLLDESFKLRVPSRYLVVNKGIIDNLYNDVKNNDLEDLVIKYSLDLRTLINIYIQKTYFNDLNNIDVQFIRTLILNDEKINKITDFEYYTKHLLRTNFDNIFELMSKDTVMEVLKKFLPKSKNIKLMLEHINRLPNPSIQMVKKQLTLIQRVEKLNVDWGLFNYKFLDLFNDNDIYNFRLSLTDLERVMLEERFLLRHDKQKYERNKIIKDSINKQKPLYYEPFNVNRNEYKVYFDGLSIDLGLVYLFDNLVSSSDIPYIKYDDYFKIYDDYIPKKEWIRDDKYVDHIILRQEEQYITINLDEKGYYINTIIHKHQTTIEKVIEKIIECCKLQIKVIEIENLNILGNYYIPGEIISRYIFKDMIMNNSEMKRYLTINDNKYTIGGTTTGRINNTINIKYYDPINKSILTGKITPRLMNQGDVGIISSEKFKMDGNVLKISISSKNVKSVKNFQDIFARLLSIYKTFEQELYKEYVNFISDFELHPTTKYQTELKNTLREQAPHIFKKRFSSFCSPHRNPIIVDPENEEFFAKMGKKFNKDSRIASMGKDPRFLLFPKDTSSGPQVWLYCGSNELYPKVGLIKNRTENSDNLAYLPCCFSQQKNVNENFKAYNMDDVVEKVTNNNRIVTTNKFLNEDDQLGILHTNVNEFFKMFEGKVFLRKGVSNHKSSFLECILYALDISDYRKKNTKERFEIVNKERTGLLYNNAMKQECYDMDKEQIQSQLTDPNLYLDPSKFISSVKSKYNTDIYIFDRNGYVTPRHINGHYRNLTKQRRTVLIYQHNGGLWSNETKCELIICRHLLVNNDPDIHVFDSSNADALDILNQIERTELSLNRLFIGQNHLIRSVVLPGLKKQYINKYGKCRLIQCGNIIFETDPIAPSDIPLLDYKDTLKTFSMKQINSYIQSNEGVTKEKSNDSSKVVVKFKGKLFTVNLTVSNSNIILNEYVFMERYSRQLFNHLLFLYSTFLNKKKHNEMRLDEFMKVIQVGNYEPELFSYEIKPKRKIILPDEKTKKHIKYNMSVYIRNNNFSDYQERTVLDNYYNNIHDFKYNNMNTIIKGKESIFQWMENTSTFDLTERIDIDKSLYGISDDTLFIKQRVTSIANGIYIAMIWYKYGYIPITGDTDEDLQYEIVHFFSGDRQPNKSIRGNIQNDYDIVIHGHVKKFKRTEYYVVLAQKYNKQPIFTRYDSVNYILHPINVDNFEGYKLYTTDTDGNINGEYKVVGNDTGIQIVSVVILGKIVTYKMNKL